MPSERRKIVNASSRGSSPLPTSHDRPAARSSRAPKDAIAFDKVNFASSMQSTMPHTPLKSSRSGTAARSIAAPRNPPLNPGATPTALRAVRSAPPSFVH